MSRTIPAVLLCPWIADKWAFVIGMMARVCHLRAIVVIVVSRAILRSVREVDRAVDRVNGARFTFQNTLMRPEVAIGWGGTILLALTTSVRRCMAPVWVAGAPASLRREWRMVRPAVLGMVDARTQSVSFATRFHRAWSVHISTKLFISVLVPAVLVGPWIAHKRTIRILWIT